MSISSGVPSKNRPQPGNIRQSWEATRGSALKLTTDEQRVTSEDRSIIAILEQVAYTILCVAWCVKSLDFDPVAYIERFAVARCFRHFGTVFAADDWYRVCFELPSKSARTR